MEGYDPNDSNMDHALTFDEWKAAGCWVRKGSKAAGWSPDGKALFLPCQVNVPRSVESMWSDGETMWERSAERAKAKGTPWGVVEDLDSFVREAGMLPDLSRRTRFAVNDPLERHFMSVADKHGILDALAFGEDGDDEGW